MVRKKKVPLRKCEGCQERKEKKSLIRIVRDPSGELHVDRTGKMPGRGAYICPNKACLEQALKKNRLDKALQVKVTSRLIEELEQSLHG